MFTEWKVVQNHKPSKNQGFYTHITSNWRQYMTQLKSAISQKCSRCICRFNIVLHYFKALSFSVHLWIQNNGKPLPNLRPSQLTWAVMSTESWHRPYPPLLFIPTTQPESWYSFCHSTEARRLNQSSHCSLLQWLSHTQRDLTQGPHTMQSAAELHSVIVPSV